MRYSKKIIKSYDARMNDLLAGSEYAQTVNGLENASEEVSSEERRLGDEIDALWNEIMSLEQAICRCEAEIAEITDIESEVDEQKIVDSFKYGNGISALSDDEIKIRNAVVAWYDAELAGEEAEAANDIYGGVTNLEIGEKYGYGHRSVKDAGEYNYWYDSEGNETGAQSKELFAEYFSYYMTGDKLAITSMREHFPQACQVLDEMLNSMKETIVEGKE